MTNTADHDRLPEDLISVNDAAMLLGVHPNTMRRYIDESALRAWNVSPIGRKLRVSESEVRAMVKRVAR